MLGPAAIEKSLTSASFTVTVNVMECDIEPPAPTMGTVYVPVFRDPAAVIVTCVEAWPLVGGITGLVAKVMVRPLAVEAERDTGEENTPEA